MNFISKLINGFYSKTVGVFGYDVLNGATKFNTYGKDRDKLIAVLANPACLKVFSLQCDLFSLGKIKVLDTEGNEIEDDPFLKMMKNPNPFQTQSQFLWDFMFWQMMGNAYCYVNSRIVDEANKLYFLENHKIDWPIELELEKDKLIFSDAKLKQMMKTVITYRYQDGTDFKFPLDRLVSSFDLTNGVGNFFKGPSRIDALYKVISNSEHSLDAKNINVRYSGKFLISTNSGANVLGLSEEERDDIRTKMDSDKKVWPLKTMAEIRRFVDNIANLQLDQSFLADYFLIGSMYGIPRDVLEAYNSSTYENQEKARASHVSYTLQPKGNNFLNSFEQHFGYVEEGKNITIDWSYLPFMQVFEKEKADKEKIKVEALTSLLALGVPIDEANEYLGLNFTINEPPAKAEGQGEGNNINGGL